jgi:hypothetical protein
VERLTTIELKEPIKRILKMNERHMLAITNKRAYTFRGVLRKLTKFTPELIASSHIYGLYQKQEIVDCNISKDYKYLLLVVEDIKSHKYYLTISDLEQPNMITEVSDSQQLGYTFETPPKFCNLWNVEEEGYLVFCFS